MTTRLKPAGVVHGSAPNVFEGILVDGLRVEDLDLDAWSAATISGGNGTSMMWPLVMVARRETSTLVTWILST
jgi:hypothetical protein